MASFLICVRASEQFAASVRTLRNCYGTHLPLNLSRLLTPPPETTIWWRYWIRAQSHPEQLAFTIYHNASPPPETATVAAFPGCPTDGPCLHSSKLKLFVKGSERVP